MAAMNVDQGLKRAILRKTANTKIPDLQPGQRVAFWRWRRRGLRKRGAWTTGRFLACDPSYPGKQCWIRSGNSTILVAMEQVRKAVGFEDWCPDEQDIRCLKDSTVDLKESVFQDLRGPQPAEDLPDALYDLEEMQLETEPTSQAIGLDTPVPHIVAPRSPAPQSAPPELPPPQRTDNYNLTLSPTFQQTTYVQQRFGDPLRSVNAAPKTPRTPRHTRSRSPAPPPRELPQPPELPQLPAGASFDENLRTAAFDSAEYGSAAAAYLDETAEQESDQLQQPQTSVLPGGHEPQEPQPSQQLQEPQRTGPELLPAPGSEAPLASSATGSAPAASSDQLQQPQTSVLPGGPQIDVSSASSSSRAQTEEVNSSQAASLPEPPPTLPQKRPFDSLTTLLADGSEVHRVPPGEDYLTGVFGPKREPFYRAYLQSDFREADVPGGKNPRESDSSDSDGETGPQAGARLSRKDAKQLDREIPWTTIIKGANVPDYLAAIDKEAKSWQEWQRSRPSATKRHTES